MTINLLRAHRKRARMGFVLTSACMLPITLPVHSHFVGNIGVYEMHRAVTKRQVFASQVKSMCLESNLSRTRLSSVIQNALRKNIQHIAREQTLESSFSSC